MIRDAKIHDYDALMPLLKQVHQQSIFNHLNIDEPTVKRHLVTALYFERGYAKVVEKNGEVVGGLVGVASPNQLGILMAQDLFMFSSASSHLLIKDFVQWAKNKGCHAVQISDFGGSDRYQTLLQKLGLSRSGNHFTEVF